MDVLDALVFGTGVGYLWGKVGIVAGYQLVKAKVLAVIAWFKTVGK